MSDRGGHCLLIGTRLAEMTQDYGRRFPMIMYVMDYAKFGAKACQYCIVCYLIDCKCYAMIHSKFRFPDPV